MQEFIIKKSLHFSFLIWWFAIWCLKLNFVLTTFTISDFELILYPRVRNSTTHLTLLNNSIRHKGVYHLNSLFIIALCRNICLYASNAHSTDNCSVVQVGTLLFRLKDLSLERFYLQPGTTLEGGGGFSLPPQPPSNVFTPVHCERCQGRG